MRDIEKEILALPQEREWGAIKLTHAQRNLPTVFQSRRFIDYLLSQIRHPDSRQHVESIGSGDLEAFDFKIM